MQRHADTGNTSEREFAEPPAEEKEPERRRRRSAVRAHGQAANSAALRSCREQRLRVIGLRHCLTRFGPVGARVESLRIGHRCRQRDGAR